MEWRSSARPVLASLLAACVLVLAAVPAFPAEPPKGVTDDVTRGALRIATGDGGVVECPLRHTDVTARIAAFVAHREYGWRLVAAAAGGELDREALAHLKIAWSSPGTRELLDGVGASIALRSLWVVTESSRAMPANEELAELARDARRISRASAGAALDTLEAWPEDAAAFAKTLYAALANRDEGAFVRRARRLLAADKVHNSALVPMRIVVAALLAPRGKADGASLVELVSNNGGGIRGADMVVLTALACRRAGGEPWHAFRAASREIMSEQPLSGSVVVLVNRLAAGRCRLLVDGGPRGSRCRRVRDRR